MLNVLRITAVMIAVFLGMDSSTLPASAAADTDRGVQSPVPKSPLKVFILAGQSNMQGHAHVRTFEHIGMDPDTAPMLEAMLGPDGSPRICDNVWISSIGSSEDEKSGNLTAGFGSAARGPKIGPEFTFGIYMQEQLNEPILIIKTAWGGKSLNTDFRPPSAGPYQFSPTQIERFEQQGKDLTQVKAAKSEATGRYYRLMVDHVNEVLSDIQRVYPDYNPAQGYEIAGFVWFQGWNDMVDGSTYPDRGSPGGYDAYSDLLAHFIRDVREDLAAPEMPFVIGVMGAGGPIAKYPAEKRRYASIHGEFRKAMAAPASLPEFRGNVVAVWTGECWDNQLSELSARNGKVGQKARELRNRDLSREEQEAALEAYRAELFTPHELEILEKGISNAEYHYLGSAKIMAQIGKAFAEAMTRMQVTEP